MPKAQKKAAVIVKVPKVAKITLPKEHKVSTEEMLGKVQAMILSRPRLGEKRKISTKAMDTGAKDNRWIGAEKRLFQSDTFKEINRVRTEARIFVANHSLPSFLKKGMYLIPKENVQLVRTKLIEMRAELLELVNKFAQEWDDTVEAAREPLGKQFNKNDYYTKEEVKRKFDLIWRFMDFDVPVSLPKEVYEEEKKKAQETWSQAGEIWKQLLRQEFQELVEHLVERLKPSKDGKKKVIRDSPFTNISEWAKQFDPRNIQDDVQLKALVEKAKGLLSGADPGVIREDEHARNSVRASFEAIKNTLSTLVIDKPSREVSFDED